MNKLTLDSTTLTLDTNPGEIPVLKMDDAILEWAAATGIRIGTNKGKSQLLVNNRLLPIADDRFKEVKDFVDLVNDAYRKFAKVS